MAATNDTPKEQKTVALLCPLCGKRLPVSGTLSMRGTTGIFCRHCRHTVQVTMEVADKKNASPVGDDEE